MTKLTFYIAIIIALTSACSKGQSFNINSIKIELDIQELIKPATKVKLTHAVRHKEYFYCFFKEIQHESFIHEQKFCFVFTNKGNDVKTIMVPEAVQSSYYYDLFVKNDSIFIKTDDDETFYFNTEKFNWVKTKEITDLIFEDEKFYIYSLDFGEWGGKTWFKDKSTGREYEIESTTPVVNKIDSTYYLSSENYVLKIKNPLLLNKSDDDVTYENIEKTSKYTSWYGKFIGAEIVYKDTTKRSYFDLTYRPHIVSSFIWKNELLHIYETDSASYIVKANKSSIKTIKKISDKIDFINWPNSYRNRIQPDGIQILKFQAGYKFGLLEISEPEINIYTLILK